MKNILRICLGTISFGANAYCLYDYLYAVSFITYLGIVLLIISLIFLVVGLILALKTNRKSVECFSLFGLFLLGSFIICIAYITRPSTFSSFQKLSANNYFISKPDSLLLEKLRKDPLDTETMVKLGDYYTCEGLSEGVIIGRFNAQLAEQYYANASMLGNKMGFDRLAWMYFYGINRFPDVAQAYLFERKALELSSLRDPHYKQNIYNISQSSNTPIPVDIQELIKKRKEELTFFDSINKLWINEGRSKNISRKYIKILNESKVSISPEFCEFMAYLYMDLDIETSKEWARKACKLGSIDQEVYNISIQDMEFSDPWEIKSMPFHNGLAKKRMNESAYFDAYKHVSFVILQYQKENSTYNKGFYDEAIQIRQEIIEKIQADLKINHSKLLFTSSE